MFGKYRRKREQQRIERIKYNNPQKYVDWLYKHFFGEKMNWKHPQNLNQWIQWIKFNGDTSQWTKLADKYLVREYLAEQGLENILVDLYGVWENPADIDFEKLPSQFVLKANHGSGEILIVKDKSQLDSAEVIKKCSDWLAQPYGYDMAEMHYHDIPRKIIAEQLLPADSQPVGSQSLIDYKVWCVGGEPQAIFVCSNRRSGGVIDTALFDTEWNEIDEYLVHDERHPRVGQKMPKPASLDEMLRSARILAKNHPQVRADFYDVDGKLYFGELTFTAMGGFLRTYTPEFQSLMGKRITDYMEQSGALKKKK